MDGIYQKKAKGAICCLNVSVNITKLYLIIKKFMHHQKIVQILITLPGKTCAFALQFFVMTETGTDYSYMKVYYGSLNLLGN